MVGNRKAETITHSLLKHIVASILERQGHKVSVEYKLSVMRDSEIADVYDHYSQLIYEIQTIKQNRQTELERTRKYCLHTHVTDVIFIYTKDFPILLSAKKLYKLVELRL